MDFEVQILGCNSAIAAHNRHPTSQVLRHGSRYFLIDCGEGTQFRIADFKVKIFRVDHIFISHLHGDHYFGLIGLITTLNLLGKNTPLTIYGPPELKSIIELQLEAGSTRRNFEVIFKSTSPIYEKIYADEKLEVYTIPLIHRIPCTGFLFREINIKRKINSIAVENLKLTGESYRALQDGEDIVDHNGNLWENEKLTLSPLPPKTYAFCSDTLYNESIIPLIENVDLLYHESTFLEERSSRATETYHSTAKQAATIALKANAKQLLLGHFSSAYPSTNPFEIEAKQIFSNSMAAVEGNIYSI